MLVTLDFFNGTYKLANHNLDSTASFISDLSLGNLSIKRGLATDAVVINLSKTVLDLVVNPLIYLVLDTPVKVEFYDSDSASFKYGIDGYISKMVNKNLDTVSMTITSKIAYHMKQTFLPEISATCQNQLFSKMCGLNKASFIGSDTSVSIDCLTGVMDYTTALETKFGSIENLNLAYVILDSNFKTRVTGVDRINRKLYIALNFMDKVITADVDIYLYCNKTFGQCYTRFNNIGNFYGLAGKGQSPQTFDVFAATGLTYCGEDVAQTPQESCSTDNNIFGIEI